VVGSVGRSILSFVRDTLKKIIRNGLSKDITKIKNKTTTVFF
jgi:hypothetical protein